MDYCVAVYRFAVPYRLIWSDWAFYWLDDEPYYDVWG